jgi:hypothetical protein
MVSMPGEAARLPPPLPVRFGLTVATSNVWQGASAPASIIAPTQTAAWMVRGSICLHYRPDLVAPQVSSAMTYFPRSPVDARRSTVINSCRLPKGEQSANGQ